MTTVYYRGAAFDTNDVDNIPVIPDVPDDSIPEWYYDGENFYQPDEWFLSHSEDVPELSAYEYLLADILLTQAASTGNLPLDNGNIGDGLLTKDRLKKQAYCDTIQRFFNAGIYSTDDMQVFLTGGKITADDCSRIESGSVVQLQSS